MNGRRGYVRGYTLNNRPQVNTVHLSFALPPKQKKAAQKAAKAAGVTVSEYLRKLIDEDLNQ